MIRTRIYQGGRLVAEDCVPELISDYLALADHVVWLDVVHGDREELALLPAEFGLHPLAVEDAVHAHQRPKVDRYRHHLFAAVYGVWLQEDTKTPEVKDGPDAEPLRDLELVTSEVDIFVGRSYLITVRKDPAWDIEPALRRWEKSESMLEHGVSFMLHGLLDEIVDQYGAVTETLDDRLDEVEERLLRQQGNADLQADLLELRRAVVGLRKVVLPLREGLQVLTEGHILDIADEMHPYFGDIKDHVLRVAGDLEAVQDLLLNAIQLNMAIASNRLNVIMRQLTGWAAILGANTVIAGIYGMNFRLWPHNDNPAGFWIALGAMVTASVFLYLNFKKREWL